MWAILQQVLVLKARLLQLSLRSMASTVEYSSRAEIASTPITLPQAIRWAHSFVGPCWARALLGLYSGIHSKKLSILDVFSQHMSFLGKNAFQQFRLSFLFINKIAGGRRSPHACWFSENALFQKASKTNSSEMGLAPLDIYERCTAGCNFMSTYLGIPRPSALLL